MINPYLIANSGDCKWYIFKAGTDTDVQISPSFTKTTENALSQFEAEERGCYTCNEVNYPSSGT